MSICFHSWLILSSCFISFHIFCPFAYPLKPFSTLLKIAFISPLMSFDFNIFAYFLPLSHCLIFHVHSVEFRTLFFNYYFQYISFVSYHFKVSSPILVIFMVSRSFYNIICCIFRFSNSHCHLTSRYSPNSCFSLFSSLLMLTIKF